MNLLEKLTLQVVDGDIKPGDTVQDWLDTLNEEQLEQLEYLVTIQEEDPENEEVDIIAQLVVALYSIETAEISVSESKQLESVNLEEEDFFKLFNSFLFLLPFYYWLKQGLVKISTKLSLVANMNNEIKLTITEYGK